MSEQWGGSSPLSPPPGYATGGKQSVTRFTVSATHSPKRKFIVNAFIVPQVTCELPAHPVSAKRNWKHLEGLRLADPEYNKPGRIDVLLGVEVFLEAMHQGRRHGPSNSPTATNTEFGWVLAGNVGSPLETPVITTHFSSVLSGDDLIYSGASGNWRKGHLLIAHLPWKNVPPSSTSTVTTLVMPMVDSLCHYPNVLLKPSSENLGPRLFEGSCLSSVHCTQRDLFLKYRKSSSTSIL